MLILHWREKLKPKTPIVINLGYNVHGNEPSSSEAALLTAYTLLPPNTARLKTLEKALVLWILPSIQMGEIVQWASTYKESSVRSQ